MISDKAKSLIENLLGWSTAPEAGEYEYNPVGMIIGGFAYVDKARSELEDYIADLEAEVAELRAYRDGYDPKEKLPEDGQMVLVEKIGRIEGFIFSQKVWNTSPFGKFDWWWPLPKGRGSRQ